MSKQCYTSTGSLSTDIPCDPNADTSACCAEGSTCVDNLYCITPWNSNVPGTCTDQSWGQSGHFNPGCPCPPREYSNMAQSSRRSDCCYLIGYVGDNPLNYVDGLTFCGLGGFVCGANNTASCNDPALLAPIISYGNDNPIPDISSPASMSSYYAQNHVSTASISTPTSQATTHSTSSTTSTSSTSSTSLSSVTSSATDTATSAASAATSSPSSSPVSSGLSTPTKAGIAIGVILGVFTFLILGWLLYRRKVRKNQKLHANFELGGHTENKEGKIEHEIGSSYTAGWAQEKDGAGTRTSVHELGTGRRSQMELR